MFVCWLLKCKSRNLAGLPGLSLGRKLCEPSNMNTEIGPFGSMCSVCQQLLRQNQEDPTLSPLSSLSSTSILAGLLSCPEAPCCRQPARTARGADGEVGDGWGMLPLSSLGHCDVNL